MQLYPFKQDCGCLDNFIFSREQSGSMRWRERFATYWKHQHSYSTVSISNYDDLSRWGSEEEME